MAYTPVSGFWEGTLWSWVALWLMAGCGTVGGNPEDTPEPTPTPEVSPTPLADGDRDGYLIPADCDDTNPDVNPDAQEVCDGGIDNDCDGNTDNIDEDGDGSTVCDGSDCNDANVDVYLGAEEVCDGLDNNCDGLTDERDMDDDGYGACDGSDCDDGDPEVHPGSVEVCDGGVDNDCNGAADEIDEDGDGSSPCDGSDCNDADPAIYSAAFDIPYDGVDQDCQGGDLMDFDGDGALPVRFGGDDCDDTDPDANPSTEVYIPPGTFEMGRDSTEPETSNFDPQHTVSLSGYCIDRLEVDTASFRACVETGGPCEAPSNTTVYDDESRSDHPMVLVSWDGAGAFCGWTGRNLPTEAQWEKAARGGACLAGEEGTETCVTNPEPTRLYPWGDASPTCDLANFETCALLTTAPVDSYAPGASPYGPLNLSGNAMEWVLDYYHADYYNTFTPEEGQEYVVPVDPTGPSSSSTRVVRGGFYDNSEGEIRATARLSYSPHFPPEYLGFRCARAVLPIYTAP